MKARAEMTVVIHDSGATFDPVWLRGLCDRAQIWVKETGRLEYVTETKGSRRVPKTVQVSGGVPTNAYVDLMFSFGLASTGAHSASRELLLRAELCLNGLPEPHQWLLRAFRQRIEQALDGKPLRGTLSSEMLADLEQLDKLAKYAADRMRQFSRVLEPDRRVYPYRHWGARLSPLDRELMEISDLIDPHMIADRVKRLLRGETLGEGRISKRAPDPDTRGLILSTGLNLAPLVGPEFARELLVEGPTAYDGAIARDKSENGLLLGVELLERALSAACIFNHAETALVVADRLERQLSAETPDTWKLGHVTRLAEPCLRLLRQLQYRAEAERLCHRLTESVAPYCYSALLPVAATWEYLGQRTRAEEIVAGARVVLFDPKTEPKDKRQLARLYAPTVATLPKAAHSLEELVTRLPNIQSGFTTGHHYSLSHLEVIEAAILAVVERNAPTALRVNG
jgi:hypothetical protein